MTALDDTSFVVTERDRTDVTMHVDNAYARYRADPSAVDSVVDLYVTSLLRARTDDGATVEQLVVIVRPVTYLRDSVGPQADLSRFVPLRPMAGDVALFLAVDSPESIRTVAIDDLKRWQIDEAAAWTHATANIHSRMGPVAVGPVAGMTGGADAIGAASGLAPSLLAEPVMCGPGKPTGGVPGEVVLVAAKDAFIFGVPDDRDSMRRFRDTAKAMIAAGGSLSATPITCRDGRWVVIPRP